MGGQLFSKMSEIQNSLKFPMGGGVKPIWEFFPNFSVFFMMAPLIKVNILVLLGERYKNLVNSTKNEEKTQIQKCSVPRITEGKII